MSQSEGRTILSPAVNAQRSQLANQTRKEAGAVKRLADLFRQVSAA